jgi:hypothetical protein
VLGFARRRRMPIDQPVGDTTEPWTYGYVVETIATRDNWMRRMDIAAATGRTPVLTADHDGVLVADVAREWAGRHGQPCALTLTSPAGGPSGSAPAVPAWNWTPSSSAHPGRPRAW